MAWPKREDAACPILSQMKAAPVPCRRVLCAWWTGERCAVLEIALFFQERRFQPPAK